MTKAKYILHYDDAIKMAKDYVTWWIAKGELTTLEKASKYGLELKLAMAPEKKGFLFWRKNTTREEKKQWLQDIIDNQKTDIHTMALYFFLGECDRTAMGECYEPYKEVYQLSKNIMQVDETLTRFALTEKQYAILKYKLKAVW